MAEKRVYWDACVWIGLINVEADKVALCQNQIDEAQKGNLKIWTSSLTLAEVYKKKCDGVDVALAQQKDTEFESYIQQEFLVEVNVDHDIGLLARRLLRQHPELKKPNDAIHLATALLNNLDELHTFDEVNLIPLSGKIPRQDGVMLTICKPPPPVQATLPLDPPAEARDGAGVVIPPNTLAE